MGVFQHSLDTGLLCYLLGIDNSNRFLKASERGHIFENMVIIDYVKRSAYSSQHQEMFFYRTHTGEEIDLLVERGKELQAYEIKFTKTPTSKMIGSLQKFTNEHATTEAALLCLRTTPLPLNKQISAKYWL